MIYWKIAAVFGIISLIGMLYSMFSGDECDGSDCLQEILRRIGAAFVVGCMWPVCLVIAVMLSIFCTVCENDE